MRTGVAHILALPDATLVKLATQQLDDETLTGPLLHEIIHHACANTAVNIALQYRWLELLRQSLSSPTFGAAISEVELLFAVDLAQVEAIFQPIAEGLAQFAEFDCPVPDDAQSATGISDGAWWRLIATKKLDTGDVRELFERCRAEMLDERTILRKVEVLCHPLRPATGNDAYLIGYLFIKSLWARFARGRATPPLRAAAFLEFVTYYFYEDWELARMMMSSDRISVGSIIDRLTARCRHLFESDIEANALAFIADKRAREQRSPILKRGPEEAVGVFRGLDLSTAEVNRGMELTARFLFKKLYPGAPLPTGHPRAHGYRSLEHEWLVSSVPPDDHEVIELKERHHLPLDTPVRFLDVLLDIPRQKSAFCHLFDIPVELRRHEPGAVIFSACSDASAQAVVASALADEVVEPVKGRLHAVLESNAFPWHLYCFLMHDSKVIAAWSHASPTPPDEGEMARFARAICHEHAFEKAQQISFDRLNEYVTANALVKRSVNEVADEATLSVAQMLRALLEGDGCAGLFRLEPVRDFGMRNVMASGKEVSCMAAAGLAASFTAERQSVDEAMRSCGYELAEALAISERIFSTHGFRWIVATPEHVVVHV